MIKNNDNFNIFKITSEQEFNELAIEIFHYQYANNKIYRAYADGLNVNIKNIINYEQIPFLPIDFFRTQKIVTGNAQSQIIFESSGTTGESTSRHFVNDLSLYEESFTKCFEYFYGDAKEWCFIGLLPSYIERQSSSLIYMVKKFIEKSRYRESGFYLNEDSKLIEIMNKLSFEGVKTIIFGVSFALLEIAEKYKLSLNDNIIIMETGGMKGRRKEIVRSDLHRIICNSFGVSKIHSEYGMTELLSQAYSKGDGIFRSPPWMKILIRDINDPLTYSEAEKTGGVNIIDLANIYSCSFIASQDLGRLQMNGSFEILGRFDNSEVRGCNQLID